MSPSLARSLATLMCVLCAGCAVERGGLRDERRRDDAGDGSGRDASVDSGRRPPVRDASRDVSSGDAPWVVPSDGGMDGSVGVDAGTDAGIDAGPPFCNPADPALVACYRFEDSVADGSLHGNNLSGSGYGFAAGRVGRALRTSAGTALTAADDDSLDLSAMTLEVWARPDAMPAAGRVALLDKDGAYGLFVHPGGEIRCAVSGGTAAAPAAISAGSWTHVACTYDGARLVIYVDGAAAGSSAVVTTIAATDRDLYIAENGTAGDDQLVGRLDELRVWDEARSPTEIAAAAAR